MSTPVLVNPFYETTHFTSLLSNKNLIVKNIERVPASTIHADPKPEYFNANMTSSLSAYGMIVGGTLDSIWSNTHYTLPEAETDSVSNDTAISIQAKVLRSWEAKALKQSIFMQLSAHPLVPLIYKEDDNTAVIEFNKHKSHFVCILDDDGIQFLWTKNAIPFSKFIPDNEISYPKMSHNVAKLLDSTE